MTLPFLVSETALYFNLTALTGALVRTNLVDAVDTTPSITVFAPVNEAFKAIGSLVEKLSTEELASVLKYHVVPNHTIYGLKDGQALKTLQGGNITIHEDNGAWYVDGATIIGGKRGGVVVGNGVVYLIDGWVYLCLLSPYAYLYSSDNLEQGLEPGQWEQNHLHTQPNNDHPASGVQFRVVC